MKHTEILDWRFFRVFRRGLIGVVFAICGLGLTSPAIAQLDPPAKPTLTDNGDGTWRLAWTKPAVPSGSSDTIRGFDIHWSDTNQISFRRYARLDLDNDANGANCPASDNSCLFDIDATRNSGGPNQNLFAGFSPGANFFAVRTTNWDGARSDNCQLGTPTTVCSASSEVPDAYVGVPHATATPLPGAEAFNLGWDAAAGGSLQLRLVNTAENVTIYLANSAARLRVAPSVENFVLSSPGFTCTDRSVPCQTPRIPSSNAHTILNYRAGIYYFGYLTSKSDSDGTLVFRIIPHAALGGRDNPVVFPTVANPPAPTGLTATHGANGVTLAWTKSANRHSRFTVYYKTSAGVTASDSSIFLRPDCINDTNNDATARSCSVTIPYTDLDGIENANTRGYFALEANINDADSVLSAEAIALPPPPTVSADGRTITFTQGATSTAENRVCATLPTIMDGEGELTHDVSNLPNWLEHRSDNGQQLCVKVGEEHAPPVTTAPHISVTYTVREAGGDQRSVTASITIRVNALPPPAESSSSSGGAIALVAIAAGAYFWWKKRQLANGADPAKMALLPDVSFDLDRLDNRAFYTKMNWANSSHSNWQLRGNATVHTKYSGKLLDWNADSHLGYRLNGKFGDFNPYYKAKFVQNDPENAEMEETYTLGVNYAISERFSVQFLQPDDEIWRYSLKTQIHLSPRLGLNFARPNSDLPNYSLGLRYQNPRGFGVSVTQPNSEIDNYSFGLQWRGASRIRYEFSGTTANNAIKLRGSFSF